MCYMRVHFHCMCRKYLTPSHFSSPRGSPWITVGERERTHALHGDILYPTTSSAAPDASARAFVVRRKSPRGLSNSPLSFYFFPISYYITFA